MKFSNSIPNIFFERAEHTHEIGGLEAFNQKFVDRLSSKLVDLGY